MSGNQIHTQVMSPTPVSTTTLCPFATFAETQAVDFKMMSFDRGLDGGGRRGLGAAFRMRGRRLRMHWRHEQLSIPVAVESALHRIARSLTKRSKRAPGLISRNEHDSGDFLVSELKKAVTVKMRANVSTNSCTKYLKTNDDLGRQPTAPSRHGGSQPHTVM